MGNALGPNITGNTIEDEEVARAESVKIDGRTYYQYSLGTPYAKTGAHQLASIRPKTRPCCSWPFQPPRPSGRAARTTSSRSRNPSVSSREREREIQRDGETD